MVALSEKAKDAFEELRPMVESGELKIDVNGEQVVPAPKGPTAAERAAALKAEIEDAKTEKLCELRSSVSERRNLAREIKSLKSRMKSAKAAYDDAVSREEEIEADLEDLDNGILQRRLPFKEPEATLEPAVDVGGEMGIESLVRDKLRELTGNSEAAGITEAQHERLRATVEAADKPLTISGLQAWIAGNDVWYRAASLKPWGEKATNDLTQALADFRTKFPEPTDEDSPMTPDAALKQATDIEKLADSLIDDCEVPEGKDFADSVRSGVRAIAGTIEKHQRVSRDQAESLLNWWNGLQKWIGAEANE